MVHVLFRIHLKTRRADMIGIIEHPNAQWLKQVARNLVPDRVGFFSY